MRQLIASTATAFVQGSNTPLSRAIDTLESLLLVHPVQGNLIIPPTCTEYTYGSNEGKCRSPLPSQSNFKCGQFGVIPLSYIGTREVCTSSYGSCTTQGPNGPGLPNAELLITFCLYQHLPHVSSVTKLQYLRISCIISIASE